MKEDFISYLWKHRLLTSRPLRTISGDELEIITPGSENTNAGPDFLAAMIRIDGTLWAGNVEIHVRSSQWFLHNHHKDKAYANIILHVVYVYDKEVCDERGKAYQHLEVKDCFEPALLNNYGFLLKSRQWIACEKLISLHDPFILKHWLYRLVIMRLERKAQEVCHFLEYFDQHQEKTLLFLISRSLGGKANAAAFGLLLQRIPYSVIVKNHDQLFTLEALLFGQAGMLESGFRDAYPQQLKSEHEYLKKKYSLPPPLNYEIWKYSRMRPSNFPDLRLAQLAMIIHRSEGQIYRRAVSCQTPFDIRHLFGQCASDYWTTRYRLDKKAVDQKKTIGQQAVNNIIINTVVPILFVHAKESRGLKTTDGAIGLLEQLPPENNNIIRRWKEIIKTAENALITQGLLELRKYYCVPKKCLKCMVGHQVLGGSKSSGIVPHMTLP